MAAEDFYKRVVRRLNKIRNRLDSGSGSPVEWTATAGEWVNIIIKRILLGEPGETGSGDGDEEVQVHEGHVGRTHQLRRVLVTAVDLEQVLLWIQLTIENIGQEFTLPTIQPGHRGSLCTGTHSHLHSHQHHLDQKLTCSKQHHQGFHSINTVQSTTINQATGTRQIYKVTLIYIYLIYIHSFQAIWGCWRVQIPRDHDK